MFKYLNMMLLFLEYPKKEIGVREFAKEMKISPASSSYKLKKLADQNLLKRKKQRQYLLYHADLESAYYLDLKIYYNILKIRKSGIIGYLNNEYLKPTIILYGSASKGLNTEDSDLDIAIISEKTSVADTHKFEKKLGEIHLVIKKNLKSFDNLTNTILNGIVLQGEIKWN